VFATLIVMLVFVPLFFLVGRRGPAAAAARASPTSCDLRVAGRRADVTPALCAYCCCAEGPRRRRTATRGWCGRSSALRTAARPRAAALAAVLVIIGRAGVAGAVGRVGPFLGRTFLPEFNEGALTVSASRCRARRSAESDQLGRRVEEILLSPRGGLDRPPHRPRRARRARPGRQRRRDRRAPARDGPPRRRSWPSCAAASPVPGMVNVTIGQPIAHRIDHMLSGTRASIAIKVFGDDLPQLRARRGRSRP
jgi:Cu/Ag efflux pump CusA